MQCRRPAAPRGESCPPGGRPTWGRRQALANSRQEARLKQPCKTPSVSLLGPLTLWSCWVFVSVVRRPLRMTLGPPLLYPQHIWVHQESSETSKEWVTAPRATLQM